MDHRHPRAEVQVDVGLARALLQDQHARLMTGSLALVDEGWDNVTYRIGADYAIRIPRRLAAVELLLNEQKWLPVLGGWLPLRVPRPIAVGAPSELFAWPWSVVEWIPGTTADHVALGTDQAVLLAGALRSLHRAAPREAPDNPFRGVPLAQRRTVVEERLRRLSLSQLDLLWRRALEAPPTQERLWLHGDLHPRNVIVSDGALVGLIDWGDMTAGDVATDLACAWMLFDSRSRDAFLEAYGPTATERSRAVGWAVNFGSALLDSGEPRHVRMGQTIIRRLLDQG